MEELRVEVGVNGRFKTKLVRIRLKWAGHVERMWWESGKENRCPESDEKRRRGRPKLHNMKTALGKTCMERVGDDWRTRAKYRRN